MRSVGAITMVFSLFFLAILDRFLKFFFFAHQELSLHIIPRIFHLEFILNTQGALSIALPKITHILLYVIAFFCVAYFFYKDYKALAMHYYMAVVYVVIGALSNLWDRIFYGGVIDMLAAPSVGACNIADIMIIIGVALWARALMLHSRRNSVDGI